MPKYTSEETIRYMTRYPEVDSELLGVPKCEHRPFEEILEVKVAYVNFEVPYLDRPLLNSINEIYRLFKFDMY